MYPLQINSHVEISQDYLLTQFRHKPNILKIVEVYIDQIQEIEFEYFALLDSLGIESAVDYGLDLIGKEVGELREGRNDADYRDAILTRIFINNSSGTPEELIAATLQITKADSIKYSEQYPAGVVLEIVGAEYVSKAPTIKKIVPAAVDLIFGNTLSLDMAIVHGGAAYTQQVLFESNPVYPEFLDDGYIIDVSYLTSDAELYAP